jgi:WD40 repeat protein
MGVIYKARQISLNREVALKMIRAGKLADEVEVASFRAEAEAAAALDHPNIVPIYEVGCHEGRQYYSMKLVQGGSLASLTGRTPCDGSADDEAPAGWVTSTPAGQDSPIRRPGSCALMPPKTAVRLMIRVARAVHYAHQRGILHRDIKPANILVDGRGEPHVTDFGLAKRLESNQATTLSEGILGTPSYLSPEQASGERVLTTSTDVYSLGAVLYELLTGNPPFTGETVWETLRNVRESEPVPPRSAHPGTDRDLETVCLKCLEKEPSRRYDSAEALAADLENWVENRPVEARSVGPPERLIRWIRRKPAMAALIALLCIVTGVGLAGIVWQWREAVAQRVAAELAVREKKEQLWQSQRIEARYHRTRSAPGQRIESLRILKEAAAFRPSIALRNEAIAALLLPDLGEIRWFDPIPTAQSVVADPTFTYYVPLTAQGRVEIRQARDQEVVTTLDRLGGPMVWAAFGSDGSRLAVHFGAGDGSQGVMGLWDWRAGRLLATSAVVLGEGSRPTLDFMSDGRELAVTSLSGPVRRFDTHTGVELEPLLELGAEAIRVAPGGRQIALLRTGELQVWNVSERRQVARWDIRDGMNDLAWHPGGERMALATARGVFLWEPVETASEPKLISDPSYISRVTFNRDGDWIFAGGWGDSGGIWDARNGDWHLRSREGAFVQLSDDESSVLFRQERKGIGVRSYLRPQGLRRFMVPESLALGGGVSAVALHPAGRLLISAQAGGLALWDTVRGRLVTRLSSTREGSAEFLPSGQELLTCGQEGIRLWPVDLSTLPPTIGRPRTLWAPEPWRFERLALSRDGRRFAAVGRDHQHAIIADVATSTFVALEGHASRSGGTYVGFSPDGRWVMTGSHQGTRVHLYDADTGRHARDLECGTGHAMFQRRGTLVFGTGVGEFGFWNVSTGERVRRGTGAADCAGFSPDDRFYLATLDTGFLHLRDADSDEELAVLEFPATAAWGSSFSPDGRRFAANNSTPQIQLWDLDELRRALESLRLAWEDPDTVPSPP